ncbi:hypothetical protein MKZ38_003966 [Zalerion maritima]|uniref:Uncharacterized protein n=1 Tax=Zalerion maritima TaxID=339359 RepID=A0AAD5WQ99_9PEZI|nr:hypothetical protein MKZ38_003966 [Zalerion maritima]
MPPNGSRRVQTHTTDFEARLETTGKGEMIRRACTAIARRLRNRRGRPRLPRQDPEGGEARRQWQQQWVTEGTTTITTTEAMQRDWKARWEAVKEAEGPQRRRNEPADIPEFTDRSLRKYKTLRKHESSALTQIRTGKIGLKAFLFQCRVPDVITPYCGCGGRETAAHVILYCPQLARQRDGLNRDLRRPLRTRRDLEEATSENGPAQTVARWMLWRRKNRQEEYTGGFRLDLVRANLAKSSRKPQREIVTRKLRRRQGQTKNDQGAKARTGSRPGAEHAQAGPEGPAKHTPGPVRRNGLQICTANRADDESLNGQEREKPLQPDHACEKKISSFGDGPLLTRPVDISRRHALFESISPARRAF